MYSVTFQQIATFLNIAKYMNLSKAAEAMFISQPALSKTLQRFEDGIGMRLFVRSNQGVTLTAEGEYLYEMLDPLYSNFSRVIDTARAISDLPPRSLRIILPPVYDVSKVFRDAKLMVRQFQETYPDIVLTESLCEFPELRNALEFGTSDIAIVQDFVIVGMKGMYCKRMAEFDMYLAMSSRHPLAGRELSDMPPSALADEVFYRVAFMDAADASDIYRRECAAYGFEPKQFEFVPNVQTLVHNVSEGKGMALCGKFNYFGEEGEVKYFPLPRTEDRKYVVAAWHSGRQSAEARLFLNMLPGDPIKA